jgi:hypothetical protein
MVEWQVNDDDESNIQTHGLSVQVIKAYASDCAATGISSLLFVKIRAHDWTLSWASWIQPTPSYTVFFNIHFKPLKLTLV